MVSSTVEMSETEVEQLRADLASVRAEVKRLRDERAHRLAQHPDRAIDDKFERVVAERDDLAGALAETERERDKAEAERDHLAEQNTALREVNVKLGRAESDEMEQLRADVEQLNQAATVIAAERDEAARKASQAANDAASLRLRCEHLEREEIHARGLVDEAREQRSRAQAALRDAEVALVEANDARRMRDSEVLHRDLTRAALTLAPPELAYACLRCGARYDFDDVDHRCGPMIPVDVIIARRPKEQP